VKWILLKPGAKLPLPSRTGGHSYTDDPDVVKRHLAGNGNVGRTGETCAVLDFDDNDLMGRLFEKFGLLPLHVETWSGKFHSYFLPDINLPATIYLDGTTVGQIRRQPTEYVVQPPSVVNGVSYRWTGGAPPELGRLPMKWKTGLEAAERAANPSGEPGERFVIPDNILAGARHRTFFRWTRSWKARRYTLEETIELLLFANKMITDPQFPERELIEYITRCWGQPDREWNRE